MAITIAIGQLGPMLRKRRRDSELSLRQVEEVTGLSASTLSRIERGQVPDLESIKTLARWLGVNVKAAGDSSSEIRSDKDLADTIEVHLRANKNLPEDVAKAIAGAFQVVMEWEIEKAKRKSK